MDDLKAEFTKEDKKREEMEKAHRREMEKKQREFDKTHGFKTRYEIINLECPFCVALNKFEK